MARACLCRRERPSSSSSNSRDSGSWREAISLSVDCDTQTELDAFWEQLSAGGEKGQCGWLKDKFGLSWQIVPSVLGEMMQDKGASKTGRVMAAVMGMKKLDIADLQQAYDGGAA